MKVKVLIADKFPEQYIKALQDLDLEVVYSPKLGENDLPEAAKEVDIVIVRSTVVNAETIKSSKRLNLIIRAGAGVNNINIAAANQKGIYVANCPGMNSIAVAELAIGLMVSLDRRIPDNVIDFRSGKWNKGEYSKAEGLFGKTLAIIQSVDRNRRTLLLMPSQGGAARQVREFVQPSGGGVSLTWSPDGKSIFYIVMGSKPDSGKRHWIIARVPADGGKVSEQSCEFGGPLFNLQFHPNGRLVSFTGRSGFSGFRPGRL